MRKTYLWLDLAAFLTTLGLAVNQHWAAKDLIWGLWISSLTLGYTFIIVGILAPFFHKDAAVHDQENQSGPLIKNSSRELKAQSLVLDIFIIIVCAAVFKLSSPVTWILSLLAVISLLLLIVSIKTNKFPDNSLYNFFVYLPGVLFLVAFFTIHFGGFHFIHGIFLNGFFPLVADNPLGKTIAGTFDFFWEIVRTAIKNYWIFIVLSAVSRMEDYLRALRSGGDKVMLLPYLNVIRMHLMIFVFAGLYILKLQNYVIYPVLFFYFFPVKNFLGWLLRLRSKPTARSSGDS